MRYFLKRADVNYHLWEEVDEYTYLNRSKVILNKSIVDEENPIKNRYNDNWIILDNYGRFNCNLIGLNTEGMAVINRIFGIKETHCNSCQTGGFLQSPEYINLMIRNKMVLHQINGRNFRAV